MPVKLEILPVTDFTGGLNLRANPLQLRGTESPDMLNVDIDPRGGFSMRKVVQRMNSTALSSVPQSIWTFATTGGTRQVLVNRSTGQMLYSTGGNFTAIVLAPHTTGGKHRATTFKDNCYIQNGTNKAVKWTGSAATELTDPVVAATWDADFASPTLGEMPIGFYTASHQGSVWVASTVENGTAFANRVRWSHPNNPESWRSQDYIDIDTGHDGDYITAIMPFAERLYVFKNNSIHVISGYSPATFQVAQLTGKVGAPSQEAVCATEDSMYFFSWPTGAYAYSTRGGLEWLFERIYPAVEDGDILGSEQTDITMAWINRRLWVSCTNTSGTTNNHVYVYDPTLGSRAAAVQGRARAGGTARGGWTQYTMELGPMVEWTPPGQSTRWLACSSTQAYVVDLEVDGDQDNVTGTPANVPSYYTTRWFDAENPALVKRWKRPEFIFRKAHTSVLSVDVYRDYDPSFSVRTFTLEPTAGDQTGSHLWGENWGTLVWGDEDEDESMQVERGSALGRSRSVRLKVSGPSTSVRWTISAVTFKFQPLRIRA